MFIKKLALLLLTIFTATILTACVSSDSSNLISKSEVTVLTENLISRSISFYDKLHNPSGNTQIEDTPIEINNNLYLKCEFGSIKEIKKLIKTTYTNGCAKKDIYKNLFIGNENYPPIFIEKNKKIYQLDIAVGYKTDWIYDSIEILEQTNRYIKLKIKTQFADEIDDKIIELKKENKNWKLNTYFFTM